MVTTYRLEKFCVDFKIINRICIPMFVYQWFDFIGVKYLMILYFCIFVSLYFCIFVRV